jgi:hypothetical protein
VNNKTVGSVSPTWKFLNIRDFQCVKSINKNRILPLLWAFEDRPIHSYIFPPLILITFALKGGYRRDLGVTSHTPTEEGKE